MNSHGLLSAHSFADVIVSLRQRGALVGQVGAWLGWHRVSTGRNSLVGHHRVGSPIFNHDVRSRGYAQLIEGASQFWPRSLQDSARRFASRLFLSREAIWLDRYIGSTPRQLVKFLDLVAGVRGEFHLRIISELSSVNAIAGVNKQFVKDELARLATGGFNVQWQALHPNDVRTVHARQLMFPSVPGIYHLPPVDRLLDTAAVGNEVDAFISKFGDWEAGERLWSQSSNWL